jgi:hypothetical protein
MAKIPHLRGVGERQAKKKSGLLEEEGEEQGTM